MGAPSIRGVLDKIRKFKKASQSLEEAKTEFLTEINKISQDLEHTKDELEELWHNQGKEKR